MTIHSDFIQLGAICSALMILAIACYCYGYYQTKQAQQAKSYNLRIKTYILIADDRMAFKNKPHLFWL